MRSTTTSRLLKPKQSPPRDNVASITFVDQKSRSSPDFSTIQSKEEHDILVGYDNHKNPSSYLVKKYQHGSPRNADTNYDAPGIVADDDPNNHPNHRHRTIANNANAAQASLRNSLFMILIAIGMFSAALEIRRTTSPSAAAAGLERRTNNPFLRPPSNFTTTAVGSSHHHNYLKSSKKNLQDEDGDVDRHLLNDVQVQGIRLPLSLQHLRDSKDPLQLGDVPFFFHIPRSGGSMVNDIMGKCIGLVIASKAGVDHADEKALEIHSSPWGTRYANVDTTTLAGIVRAYQFRMMEANAVDFVSSPFLHEGAYLFNSKHQGRMFTLIRNPVDRLVSLYNQQMFEWAIEKKNITNKSFSLNMWAHSDYHEKDWITRHLVNQLEGDLVPGHLEIAKEILRRFCIVGLFESKDESMRRILDYFNFELNSDRSIACKDRTMHYAWRNKLSYRKLHRNSTLYQTLAQMNPYDMELYDFAQRLFFHQTELFE